MNSNDVLSATVVPEQRRSVAGDGLPFDPTLHEPGLERWLAGNPAFSLINYRSGRR